MSTVPVRHYAGSSACSGMVNEMTDKNVISLPPVKVGLLGLGTVGGGTLTVLKRNRHEICRRAGRDIQVVCATARDISKPRGLDLQEIRLTTDPFEVVNDPEVEVVVELIGGETLAKDLVLAAIRNGKHVVTANKALIALHGNEIFEAAQASGVDIAFEAAVAGGIPIIKAIREGLAANHIESVAGIINGTGNYILTQMQSAGRDFADVLAEAQKLGYAEADPTFDVEGIDAAHKLTILASIAFGMPLRFSDIHTQGISIVSADDVSYASELGYRIKHLGIAKRRDNGVELRVQPTLIPKRALLANIDGVMNAVMVQGDAVGPTTYCGAGAGAEATASAVVADLVDVVRLLTADPEHKVPHLGFQADAIDNLDVLPIEQVVCPHYLHLLLADESGVLAKVTGELAELDINIEAIIQKEPAVDGADVPVIILTDEARESSIEAALARIKALPFVREGITRLRVETFDD